MSFCDLSRVHQVPNDQIEISFGIILIGQSLVRFPKQFSLLVEFESIEARFDSWGEGFYVKLGGKKILAHKVFLVVKMIFPG